MVFPVVVYRCVSWIIKKAEWCFRIVVLERWPFRIPRTVRTTRPILKEMNTEYSEYWLEGLMLKLQYFGHLMQIADSLENTLMLAKIEVKRRRGKQRIKWLDSITSSWTWIWANSRRQWSTEKPGLMQSVGSQRVGQDLISEQQGKSSNGESWTNLKSKDLCLILSSTSCMNLYVSNLISLRPSFINKMFKNHLPHKTVLRNNWNNACKSYL